ncbi:glycosyltransferase family 2 protein [Halorubrum ezzemoulense]|uniref:glycosyltransferase family 2 protein n=1 Tax=Halorubrum ezzemoulense TaxID=337243 RepID=UPI002330AEB2|nr:glycosyltransferase family 2 protein [Halorubrum ezzemoulense]MDB2248607.1 glycosyltransferase family 2 protein [Halorubrum ezzemoulense]
MSRDSRLVSVIIPTYDRPEHLKQALDSVLSQGYEPIEVVVVDDCPSHPVKETVRSYSSDRIQYIQHSKNKGVCAARNTGIQNASGKYVSFLDDDDRWSSEKVEKQVQLLETTDDAGVVYTGARRVDESENTISVSIPEYNGAIAKEILLNDFVPFSTILTYSNVIKKSGKLDEKLTNWEDWEWCIRLAEQTEFEVIEEALVITDRGSHNQRSDNFEQKRDVGYGRFVKAVQPIAAQYGTLFKRKWKGHTNFHLGYAALSNGYYSDARKLFYRAIQYWPFVRKFYMYFSIALTGKRGYLATRSLKRWVVDKIN